MCYTATMDTMTLSLLEKIYVLCGDSAVRILDYAELGMDGVSVAELMTLIKETSQMGYLVLKYIDHQSVCVGMSPAGLSLVLKKQAEAHAPSTPEQAETPAVVEESEVPAVVPCGAKLSGKQFATLAALSVVGGLIGGAVVALVLWLVLMV